MSIEPDIHDKDSKSQAGEQIRRHVPIAVPSISDHDVESVRNAVSSGWISGRGKYVELFEQSFGDWLGTKNVVACSSGTSALHLALLASGVGSGSEVIIPALSMGAIPFAVTYVGAKQVLVDSEFDTWNMNPDSVNEKITSRTKAIIAMHTYGHPTNLAPLIELCRDSNIKLIEDAAEAHGAEFQGRKVGAIGDFGCFSFFANKIITTGEGGAVVAKSLEDADNCRALRDMAFSREPSKKFLHSSIGYNYRLTNMQAALGYSQMSRINEFIDLRRKNASHYNARLSGVNGITLPPQAPWAKSVYWMYSILVDPNKFGMNRDSLMLELSNLGIETRPFFVPVHEQPVFRSQHIDERYPNAELLSKKGLNLPSGNTLTEDEVNYVADSIASLSADLN